MHGDRPRLPTGTNTIAPFKIVMVIVFTILLLVTLIFVNGERTRKIDAEIDYRSSAFIRKVIKTLGLSVHNLQSASNVIVYFENISIKQFQGITARNFESDPGLLIIEWQPIVKGIIREQFIKNARLGGLPNFRLWEPDSNGTPIAAGMRKEHVPVYFMRSRDIANDQLDTLGLDLAWSDERMISKLKARDTGIAQASELFNVVTGPNNNYEPLGFAITLPIYKNGIVPVTTEDRQRDILGYMAGVYSLEDLLAKDINELAEQGFNIVIHDERDDAHRLEIDSAEGSQFSKVEELDIYGNRLYLHLIATDKFVAKQFEFIWLLLPAFVLAFGILIYIFLRRIEQLNKQIRQSHKFESLGVLAGGIAHNFNNHLAIIMGNIELLALEVKGNKDAEQCIEESKTTIMRSKDLIDQILTYSRKGVVRRSEPCEIGPVVSEALKLLEKTSPSTIQFHLTIEDNVEGQFVLAGNSQIQDTVINLCNNAIYAMQDEGELTVRLSLEKIANNTIPETKTGLTAGEYIILEITDSGCGMSEELMEKIFDPFYTTKSVDEGTGMGLSMVHGVLEQSKGFITLTSKQNVGTTFRLHFATTGGAAILSTPEANDKIEGKARILFVDDEIAITRYSKQLLTKAGYEVVTENNPKNALETFKKSPDYFDIVITDQKMPELTGMALSENMLQFRPDIPIVLFSGYNSMLSEEDVKGAGIRELCFKPLEIKDLMKKIESLL